MFVEYSPYEWLMIDIANHFGLDKELFEIRIAWVDANHHHLEELTGQADKPILFSKAVHHLRLVERGVKTNHLVGLDASASAFQLMAVLKGCKISLEQTNLIDTGVYKDPYGDIIPAMNKYLPEEKWLYIGSQEGHLSRKEVKDAAMPMSYGSVLAPIEVFGDGTPELKAFRRAILNILPAAVEVPKELRSLWNYESGVYKWRKQFGGWARCVTKPPLDQEPTRIYNIYGLGNSSVSIMMDMRGKPSDNNTPIIANVIQGEESDICGELIRRCYKSGFNILPIHDCFYCHPNNCNTMRKHYNDICAEKYEANRMEQIGLDLTGEFRKYTQKDVGLGDLIKQANYALA